MATPLHACTRMVATFTAAGNELGNSILRTAQSRGHPGATQATGSSWNSAMRGLRSGSTLGDANADGIPELVVGIQNGGLRWFSGTAVGIASPVQPMPPSLPRIRHAQVVHLPRASTTHPIGVARSPRSVGLRLGRPASGYGFASCAQNTWPVPPNAQPAAGGDGNRAGCRAVTPCGVAGCLCFGVHAVEHLSYAANGLLAFGGKAFSSSLRSSSMIFSMPFLPSFTGTPKYKSLMPYSPIVKHTGKMRF